MGLGLKVFAYTLYYISFVLYYGFFIGLAVGHGYFYATSFNVEDCYAHQSDKNDFLPYTVVSQGGKGYQNVSENFRIVNLMGLIAFSFIGLILMYIHAALAYDNDYEISGSFFFLGLASIVMWLVYYFTLLVMRLRHAGLVCSGQYLGHPHTFHNGVIAGPPYIKENGTFMYYAMIGEALFFVVMISGVISIAN